MQFGGRVVERRLDLPKRGLTTMIAIEDHRNISDQLDDAERVVTLPSLARFLEDHVAQPPRVPVLPKPVLPPHAAAWLRGPTAGVIARRSMRKEGGEVSDGQGSKGEGSDAGSGGFKVSKGKVVVKKQEGGTASGNTKGAKEKVMVAVNAAKQKVEASKSGAAPKSEGQKKKAAVVSEAQPAGADKEVDDMTDPDEIVIE